MPSLLIWLSSGQAIRPWRIGDAGGVNVIALEAFRGAPDLRSMRVSTVEIYSDVAPPPNPTVISHAVTERDAPMIFYTLVLARHRSAVSSERS